MRYLDEFREERDIREILEKIRACITPPVKLMEVCGTHTMAIFRHGIVKLLPEKITLVSGPGCPVCVTPIKEIDKAIKLSREKGVIITTFGDLLRVPGSNSSLEKERARGAEVKVVYSTYEALKIARSNPRKKVVFLGVGFETTVPTVAAALLKAHADGIKNFFVLSFHKLVPPALETLLRQDGLNLSGLILPGHVSVIIGSRRYQSLADIYHVPGVVGGFEPRDILEAIYMLLKQIQNQEARIEIQYQRGVSLEGNKKAQRYISHVFEPFSSSWRGLGEIPLSGLKLREDFATFDGEKYFDLEVPEAGEPEGCCCGEVLRGIKSPNDCPLFGKRCSPENPVGACMVSHEGTCAAYYKYQGRMAL